MSLPDVAVVYLLFVKHLCWEWCGCAACCNIPRENLKNCAVGARQRDRGDRQSEGRRRLPDLAARALPKPVGRRYRLCLRWWRAPRSGIHYTPLTPGQVLLALLPPPHPLRRCRVESWQPAAGSSEPAAPQRRVGRVEPSEERAGRSRAEPKSVTAEPSLWKHAAAGRSRIVCSLTIPLPLRRVRVTSSTPPNSPRKFQLCIKTSRHSFLPRPDVVSVKVPCVCVFFCVFPWLCCQPRGVVPKCSVL